MRIAVIGAGIAGLASAWLLSRKYAVTLFEAQDYLGGHTHTHDLELEGRGYAVDTGFIVYNERHYPLLTRCLPSWACASQPTTMSFSVRNEASGLEYNATSLNALFCQRRNLPRARFWGMLRDLLRFYREAPALLADAGPGPTLGSISPAMATAARSATSTWCRWPAALWSSPAAAILDFPAHYLVRFMANHQMLQLRRPPAVAGRVGRLRQLRAGAARALAGAMSACIARCCPCGATRAGVCRCTRAPASSSSTRSCWPATADQCLALLADASEARARSARRDRVPGQRDGPAYRRLGVAAESQGLGRLERLGAARVVTSRARSATA